MMRLLFPNAFYKSQKISTGHFCRIHGIKKNISSASIIELMFDKRKYFLSIRT
ncbi:hypothetical protein BRYFOR_07936 [Marvinbryantia formatexigens DSM 14469]|uniref:Uncharacterized protein n=1 Tax=Marvinbryantia formatexigens DSM 14469 TaxID=478749 RepID=C6LH25_9FIRM|nr:hypothetical protein BRYFOR_07936 [Marvinbryantia formatexigens DSM 14469]